jgi:hypothetical protein
MSMSFWRELVDMDMYIDCLVYDKEDWISR